MPGVSAPLGTGSGGLTEHELFLSAELVAGPHPLKLLLVPPAWGLKPQEPRARFAFAIHFAIELPASLKVGKEVLWRGNFSFSWRICKGRFACFSSEPFVDAQMFLQDFVSFAVSDSSVQVLRPGWMGLGAVWSGKRCPCQWYRVWNEMVYKIPFKPNHSRILWAG